MFFCHLRVLIPRIPDITNIIYLKKHTNKVKIHTPLHAVDYIYRNTYHKQCADVVSDDRRMYRTSLAGNGGSATVEASVVLPLFLFAMFAIFSLANCLRVKTVVYEGFHEAAEYAAEYSYLCRLAEEGLGIEGGGIAETGITAAAVKLKLDEYIDDEELIKEYVVGGLSGIGVVQAELRSDNYLYLKIKYKMNIQAPVIGSVRIFCEEKIRQRAYLGYDMSVDSDSEGSYVYVAENGDVYHKSRNCYHIKLTVSQVSESELENGIYKDLTSCSLCARYKSNGNLYVTESGDRVHYSLGCSGLKRTVYRVKKDESGGLRACSNCGG